MSNLTRSQFSSWSPSCRAIFPLNLVRALTASHAAFRRASFRNGPRTITHIYYRIRFIRRIIHDSRRRKRISRRAVPAPFHPRDRVPSLPRRLTCSIGSASFSRDWIEPLWLQFRGPTSTGSELPHEFPPLSIGALSTGIKRGSFECGLRKEAAFGEKERERENERG